MYVIMKDFLEKKLVQLDMTNFNKCALFEWTALVISRTLQKLVQLDMKKNLSIYKGFPISHISTETEFDTSLVWKLKSKYYNLQYY